MMCFNVVVVLIVFYRIVVAPVGDSADSADEVDRVDGVAIDLKENFKKSNPTHARKSDSII